MIREILKSTNLEKTRLPILKLVLLLGIFSFLGFNSPTHSHLQQTFSTEVYDSRKQKDSSAHYKSVKNLKIIFYTSKFKSFEIFNIWKIIYQNQLFETRVKALAFKFFPCLVSETLLQKIPSSPLEEVPFI